MDPITLSILFGLAAAGSGVAGSSGAVALKRLLERAFFPKKTPQGEQIVYEKIRSKKLMAAEMAQRMVITHTMIEVGRVQTGQKAVGERPTGRKVKSGRQLKKGERLASYQNRGVIKVGEYKVGERKVDERVVRHDLVEHPVPADRMGVRPIRGLHEAHRVLHTELILPTDLQELRILTGQAMVLAHFRRVPVMEDVMEPIMEDMMAPLLVPVMADVMEDEYVDEMETIWEAVYKPEYRRRNHAVYLLVDVSGSMETPILGNAWAGSLSWKAAEAIYARCVEEQIPFFCRAFDHLVYPLFSWKPGEPVEDLRAYLKDYNGSGGTDINKIIRTAENDLSGQGLDSADMMIHTDGEDEHLSMDIRFRLNRKNIKLHAQLYGRDNKSLRMIAHTWSLSPSWQWISQVVENH